MKGPKLLFTLSFVALFIFIGCLVNIRNFDLRWILVFVILMIIAVIDTVVAVISENKNFKPFRKKKKHKRKSAGLTSAEIQEVKETAVPAEQIVSDYDLEILSDKTVIELKVWGKKLEVKVSGDGEEGEPLSEKERAALVWLIEEAPYETDEVKSEVLRCINMLHDDWDDEWEECDSEEILPYETLMNSVCIRFDGEDEEDTVIALCGECEGDVEHGISVVFKNKEFSGVGSFMDFENADSLYDRRTGKPIEKEEKYELIEQWGFADAGGVFELYSFGGSDYDAEHNRIEKGEFKLNAGGYQTYLFTVRSGKLYNYFSYGGLFSIETDKELKSMLNGFHTEYDLKNVTYTVKEIAINKCEVPWNNYKKIKRLLLNFGGEDNILDIVFLNDEYDKLERLLAFIDKAQK